MTFPSPKRFYTRQKKTHTSSLVGWDEGVTGDGDGKVAQEIMTDADAAKVTAKKNS